VPRRNPNGRILLVNPWIHDFSAFDFWQKPLGLLYIGAVLNRLGYDTVLLDCLDRYNPFWRQRSDEEPDREKSDGAGKYFRQELDKPAPLQGIPRRYCRYGAPRERVEAWLAQQEPPDFILVTSAMTYWYPGLVETAELLRSRFPHAPLILGGIYATLCPDHARRVVKPDHLVAGEGEIKAIRLVSQLSGGPGGDFDFKDLDQLPYPWYEGYPHLASIAVLTSRGCPYCCSYCASGILAASCRRRSAGAVFEEIRYWRDRRGISSFAFYDDALLHEAETHAIPLFSMLAAELPGLSLHTPNGVQPRCIDAEMAALMHAAGMKNLRLSYESSSALRRQGKVTTRELASALKNLLAAGFQSGQIGVYILAGLPGQEMEEVRESARQVHDLGARVNLASYSPIPGTREYQHALDSGSWDGEEDLLLGNNSLYPFWRRQYTPVQLEGLALWVKELNLSLLSNHEE